MARKLKDWTTMTVHDIPINYRWYKIGDRAKDGTRSQAVEKLMRNGHEIVDVRVQRRLYKPDIVHIRPTEVNSNE